MADPTPPTAPAPLDFSKADYVAPQALACAVCKSAIASEYYDVNRHPVCPACLQGIEARRAGDWTKALALGLGAAVAGAVVWYAVAEYAHIQAGLIALGIGWAVGKGVRQGAGGDSSTAFPVAAVLLTYLSIAGAQYLILAPLAPGAPFATMAMLALEAPIRSNDPIGWFIVAIGLYEAWRFSRGPRMAISGPFPVTRGSVG